MKVRVFAPGFCSFDSIDSENYMELKEGSTLNHVYSKLKIPLPLRPILICLVNYDKAKLSTRLKDGDVISFIGPLAGG